MDVYCKPNLLGGISLGSLLAYGAPNPDNLWLRYWVWSAPQGWVATNWIGPWYAPAGAVGTYIYSPGTFPIFTIGRNVWYYFGFESWHQSYGFGGFTAWNIADTDGVLAYKNGPWCLTTF